MRYGIRDTVYGIRDMGFSILDFGYGVRESYQGYHVCLKALMIAERLFKTYFIDFLL